MGCFGFFISIHALLAESDAQFIGADAYLAENISIHALLAESDSSIEEVSKYVVISIHALLAESDAGVDGLRRW